MRKCCIEKHAMFYLLTSLMLFCAACGNSNSIEDNSTETAETAASISRSETAEAKKTAETTQDWRALYEQELDRISGYGELEWNGYYDISRDGVPELFLGSRFGGDCQIFTIKEDQVQYVTFIGEANRNAVSEGKAAISFCDGQAVLEWENGSDGGCYFAVMDEKQNATVGSICTIEADLLRLNGEYVEKEVFLEKFPIAETLLAVGEAKQEALGESAENAASETRENQTETLENTVDWRALYEQEIEALFGYAKCEYQEYYDISGDGVPELLVSADGYGIDIFTIADGKVQYVACMGVSMSSNLSENDGCIVGMYLYEGMAVLAGGGSSGTGYSFTVMDEEENVTVGRYCTFHPEKFWLNGEYVEQETFLDKFPIAEMLLDDSDAEKFYELIKEYQAERITGEAESNEKSWKTDGFSLGGESGADASDDSADWMALYEGELERISSYSELYYKWYYDISGDGVPELFLRFRREGDLRIYTIENGTVQYVAILNLSGLEAVYFDDGRVRTTAKEE